METFSALLNLYVGNSPVTGEFPWQRPVTWSFDVFFDLCLNKQLSKPSWGWWFETPSRPLWRYCNIWVARYAWLLSWFARKTLRKNINTRFFFFKAPTPEGPRWFSATLLRIQSRLLVTQLVGRHWGGGGGGGGVINELVRTLGIPDTPGIISNKRPLKRFHLLHFSKYHSWRITYGNAPLAYSIAECLPG